MVRHAAPYYRYCSLFSVSAGRPFVGAGWHGRPPYANTLLGPMRSQKPVLFLHATLIWPYAYFRLFFAFRVEIIYTLCTWWKGSRGAAQHSIPGTALNGFASMIFPMSWNNRKQSVSL